MGNTHGSRFRYPILSKKPLLADVVTTPHGENSIFLCSRSFKDKGEKTLCKQGINHKDEVIDVLGGF